MEPKFQSSFIPKGPFVSDAGGIPVRKQAKEKSLFTFISSIIFTLSVIMAIGVFGYKFYLKYSIDKMDSSLQMAQSTLQPDTINQLVRLDNRMTFTKNLISKHHILTPLFGFLEDSTPITVRFNDFQYSTTRQGIEIAMKGQARGYSALALQADIFDKSDYFKDSVFSDLNLNESGDVNFSFRAIVNPDLVLYKKEIERISAPTISPTNTISASSTSSQTATSTIN